MAKVKAIKQLTNQQFDDMFPNEDACKAYLTARRWPKGVHCPRCGNVDVYPVTNRPFHWQCSKCPKVGGYRFSVLVKTIFENTNKPLRDWLKVAHLMLTSKKGMSALQIMRYMGFGSYKTAWLMCHKIRTALMEANTDKLAGIVEMDETNIGGKDKNRHWDKRSGTRGRGYDPLKTPVIGAVKRKGNVVARVVLGVDQTTVDEFMQEAVSRKVSLLCTDAYTVYKHLAPKYPHGVVDHSIGQHVVGAIHTNTIEGFWSLIKRGIMGSYHKVSRKYLPLYVAEFQFRYNNRLNPDIFDAAIARC
jgi:transposase-like protein/IS1 family transposase